MSSSFVPRTTSMTTLTAAATNAARSAHRRCPRGSRCRSGVEASDEHRRVRDEDEQEARDEREGQRAARRQRRDDRVQHRDDERRRGARPGSCRSRRPGRTPAATTSDAAATSQATRRRTRPELRARRLPGDGLGVRAHRRAPRPRRGSGGGASPSSLALRWRSARFSPSSRRAAPSGRPPSPSRRAYDSPTSVLPPVQPKTQTTRTMAKRTFQAVVISCCAVE